MREEIIFYRSKPKLVNIFKRSGWSCFLSHNLESLVLIKPMAKQLLLMVLMMWMLFIGSVMNSRYYSVHWQKFPVIAVRSTTGYKWHLLKIMTTGISCLMQPRKSRFGESLKLATILISMRTCVKIWYFENAINHQDLFITSQCSNPFLSIVVNLVLFQLSTF